MFSKLGVSIVDSSLTPYDITTLVTMATYTHYNIIALATSHTNHFTTSPEPEEQSNTRLGDRELEYLLG